MRLAALKALAVLVSAALAVANFGLIDLADGFTGYVDEARNQVLDAGWGALFGIVVPIGLLAQLRRPERRIAGLQQLAVASCALAGAAAAATAWDHLVLAGLLAAACGAALLLHPARASFLRRGARPRPLLALAAAVALAPALVYAERMSSAGRRGLPPLDAETNGLAHWPALAALALVVVALPLLAAAGTAGWELAAGTAALAALAWGIACVLAPTAAAAEGAAWGWAAVAWALLTGLAGAVEHGRYGQRR